MQFQEGVSKVVVIFVVIFCVIGAFLIGTFIFSKIHTSSPALVNAGGDIQFESQLPGFLLTMGNSEKNILIVYLKKLGLYPLVNKPFWGISVDKTIPPVISPKKVVVIYKDLNLLQGDLALDSNLLQYNLLE